MELEAGSRQCTVLIIIFVPEAVFVYDVQLRLLCEIRLINSQRGRSLDWSLLSVVIFVNRDFGNLLLAVSVEFFWRLGFMDSSWISVSTGILLLLLHLGLHNTLERRASGRSTSSSI